MRKLRAAFASCHATLGLAVCTALGLALCLVFCLAFCLALSSCVREDFHIDRIIAVPYVVSESESSKITDCMKADSGNPGSGSFELAPGCRMGMALYIRTSLDEDENPLSMVVASPDGVLVWSFTSSCVTHDGVMYAGSSDICMPMGVKLPEGEWTLDVALPDGREFSEKFDLIYKADAAQDWSGERYGVLYASSYSDDLNLALLKSVGDAETAGSLQSSD